MTSTGAALNRGRSKQDYWTPTELIKACEKRFGAIALDLAATRENAVSGGFIGPEMDSLTQDWSSHDGLLFLNPPFANIGPWAAKCAHHAQRGAKILLLTPASVGANWFRDYVLPYAAVYALSPRIKFFGCETVYPKDIVISGYNLGFAGRLEVWRWKP